MNIRGLFQEAVDRRIQDWKLNFPHAVEGKQAIREFADFTFDADEWFSLSELPALEFRPENAPLLRRKVSRQRVHQLEKGAPMTEGEAIIWSEIVAGLTIDAEYISVCQLQATDGTVVWFMTSMNGFHLRSSIINAAGPFWNRESVILACAARVRTWNAWWEPAKRHEEAGAMCDDIEQISHKKRVDFHTLSAYQRNAA